MTTAFHDKLNTAIIGSDSFLDAFKRLTTMVNIDYGIALLAGFNRYLEAFQQGRTDYLETIHAVYVVPIVIALLHVEMGTPLFMSDELLEAWAVNDDVAECRSCGYRQPAKNRTCVLCGSATGETGIWAKTRAARAVLN